MLTLDPFTVNAEVIFTIELTLEQLQRKQTVLEELDTKIAPLITEELELEEEIMEAEDTRIKILHAITRLRVKLSPTNTAPEPVSMTASRSQPSATDGTVHTDSSPVVSSSSDSTLYTTSHACPTSEATDSIPVSCNTGTLSIEDATVGRTASHSTREYPWRPPDLAVVLGLF